MKYETSITAMDVANHIARLAASEAVVLDPMKLQKILYYSQCWYLADTGAALFPDRFKAWKWGPVVPSVWHEYSGNEADPKPDQELSQEQRNVVESVWLALKDLGSMELSDMTHVSGSAWKKARGDIPDTEPSIAALDPDDMRLEVEGQFSAGQKWLGDNLDELRRECA